MIKQFFEQGYSTIANVLTPEAVSQAKKILSFWNYKYLSGLTNGGFNGMKKSRGYIADCVGDIAWDMDLLALYYLSPLPHIMQQLMGVNEVEHPKHCRPTMIFPSFDLTDSPAFFGDKWTIDGFTATGGHSPYNILIGIALTDVTDIDQVSSNQIIRIILIAMFFSVTVLG